MSQTLNKYYQSKKNTKLSDRISPEVAINGVMTSDQMTFVPGRIMNDWVTPPGGWGRGIPGQEHMLPHAGPWPGPTHIRGHQESSFCTGILYSSILCCLEFIHFTPWSLQTKVQRWYCNSNIVRSHHPHFCDHCDSLSNEHPTRTREQNSICVCLPRGFLLLTFSN